MEVRDIQMSYTIDNPKLVKYWFDVKEDNFTGVVKDEVGHIIYYENGKRHREDGSAVEYPDGRKYWFIHGKCHREDGPAVEFANGNKEWWYHDKRYGYNDDFTIESWKQKWKLEIFK